MRVPFLALALLVAWPADGPAGGAALTVNGACPTSRVALLSGSGSASTATFDSTYGAARVTYDLREGRLTLSQGAGGSSQTFLETVDAYDVQGVPAGTPVALTVALDLNAGATNFGCAPDCGGWFSAAIVHATDAAADSVLEPSSGYTMATTPMVETLQLPLTIVAGTPEVIMFKLYDRVTPGSNGGGFGTGLIHFLGVPAGVTVTSCQGYGTGATPTRPASWGSLKVIYR